MFLREIILHDGGKTRGKVRRIIDKTIYKKKSLEDTWRFAEVRRKEEKVKKIKK